VGYQPVFTPWRWLMKLPEFNNLLPGRWVLMGYLATACMLGIVVDHAYRALRAWHRHRSGRPGTIRATAVALSVAAVAVVPTFLYLGQSLPMTTEAAVVPAYFKTAATHLGPKQVLLVVPAPFSEIKGADAWQAVDRDVFSMAGGPGPESVPSRNGRQALAMRVLTAASVDQNPAASFSAGDVEAVRRALNAWGVTEVVIPDQPGLPLYDRPSSIPGASALITAATGILPTEQASAWVWRGWSRDGSAPAAATARLAECTDGLPSGSAAAVRKVTSCVLGHGGLRTG
jgi:hypothetical protein